MLIDTGSDGLGVPIAPMPGRSIPYDIDDDDGDDDGDDGVEYDVCIPSSRESLSL